MKKFLKTILSSILALGLCLTGAACGDTGSGSGDTGGPFVDNGGKLVIRYFKGGYGDEWLKDSVKNFFTDLRGHAIDGQDYQLIEDSGITMGQDRYLKGRNNIPDILITQGGYETYLEGGYIADLSSVMEMEVEKLDGSKIKIKDYMLPSAYQSVTRQMKYGVGEAKSWVMPWSAETFSLAYNETLLLETVHTASSFAVADDIAVGGKWTRPPQTTDELLAYFVDVNASNATKPAERQVVPFGWSYGSAYASLQFVINSWWAQIQGTHTSKIEGEGSFYDFFNFNDLDLFDQTGIQMAYDTMRSLIIDANGNYINSDMESNNYLNLDFPNYKENSANGRYAVWVAGDYWDNEVIKDDAPFVTKFMFVPNAKGADGKYTNEKITFVRLDEAMYIPAKAENKELAKQFLAFMCNEAELVNYSKRCGGLRPFQYNPAELVKDYEWNEFQKSFFDIYNNADEIITEFPSHLENPADVSPVILHQKQLIHYYGTSFNSIFSDNNRTKPASEIFAEVKDGYRDYFETWELQYGAYFQQLGN